MKDWLEELDLNGRLDYRTVQIMTEHGVFGKFLCRIDLPLIIAAALQDPSRKKAFTDYCKEIMSVKEENKRKQRLTTGLRRKRRPPAHLRKD
ncbi:hypothetical protein PUN28_017799 [Cardiocondyla obscurior]|uniref:Uncharacterized protein n=1 Tax=Cardiocondyla obscurior TaxID=286306 RepID=A0AAW2EPH8_9HYME